MVHVPALVVQQGRDPAIAVPAALTPQADNRRRQRLLVIPMDRLIALCRPELAQNSAGMAFGDRKSLSHVIDTTPAAVGAYPFPSAASLRISLSRVSSVTARLRRVFSCSSSFSRRACSTFRPTYSRRQR